jgi:bifunctional ADP-heptose synthase (sugar kinase/adenylyltransferase)
LGLAALPRSLVFISGVFGIPYCGHVSYLAGAQALSALLREHVKKHESTLEVWIRAIEAGRPWSSSWR